MDNKTHLIYIPNGFKMNQKPNSVECIDGIFHFSFGFTKSLHIGIFTTFRANDSGERVVNAHQKHTYTHEQTKNWGIECTRKQSVHVAFKVKTVVPFFD